MLSNKKVFAFFSWLFLGTTAWLILGTTTVISLIILIINILQKEDYYIEKLGNYLTGAAGLKISFEGKFSSSFREGKLSLHRVTIANIDPNATDTVYKKKKKKERKKEKEKERLRQNSLIFLVLVFLFVKVFSNTKQKSGSCGLAVAVFFIRTFNVPSSYNGKKTKSN